MDLLDQTSNRTFWLNFSKPLWLFHQSFVCAADLRRIILRKAGKIMTEMYDSSEVLLQLCNSSLMLFPSVCWWCSVLVDWLFQRAHKAESVLHLFIFVSDTMASPFQTRDSRRWWPRWPLPYFIICCLIYLLSSVFNVV